MTRLSVLTFCLVLACGGSEPPPSEQPPPSSTVSEPAASPCTADADCVLWNGPACSCHAALATASVTADMTPCFVAPCMNQEPYCDAASHQCMVRRVPPPAPPTDVAPPS